MSQEHTAPSEAALKEELQAAAGLTVISSGASASAPAPTAEGQSTALVVMTLPPHLRRYLRPMAALFALTDTGRGSRDSKIEKRLARIVRRADSPDLPHVVHATFETGKGDFIMAKISVPDPNDMKSEITVTAVPHILCDGIGGFIPFVHPVPVTDDAGNITGVQYEARDLWSAVQAPNFVENGKGGVRPADGEYYRLMPLGTAPGTVLNSWNRAARGYASGEGTSSYDWPEIEPIPHNLDGANGTRYLVWTPQGLAQMPGKGRKTYTFGKVFGMTTIAEGKNDPTPDYDADGNVSFKAQVFTVDPRDRALGLKWQRPFDPNRLKRDGVLGAGAVYHMDGFEALMIDPLDVDPTTLTRFSMAIATAIADGNNALFVYGLSTGETELDLTADILRGILIEMAKSACRNILARMDVLKSDTVVALSRGRTPTLDKILNEESAYDVYFRTSGDDVLAAWINDHIEGNFTWSAWLHREIRKELMAIVLRQNEQDVPVRVKHQRQRRGGSQGDGAQSAGINKVTEASSSEPASETADPKSSDDGKKAKPAAGSNGSSSASQPQPEETPRERKNRLARERRTASKLKAAASNPA